MRPAISAQQLTKRFQNAHGGFTALDQVSFDIQAGETVGIIGRNGAGKSTLLKILSRILAPSSGRVELDGRVGSLLEIGTGFHPELTGRENIFLSAALLGMKDAEIARRLDAIIDFSGIEAFLDEPVKHYSSGMYMRLAFSVAAHLEPEILLVDEVLAVGDAEFQRKCLQRLDRLGQGGQTVLFVSHNMQAVTRLCRRGIWIDKGRIAGDGTIAAVTASYLKQGAAHPGQRIWDDGPHAPGDDVVRLRSARVLSPDGQTTPGIDIGSPFSVEFEFQVMRGDMVLFPILKLFNEWGTEVIWATDAGAPGHGQPRPPGRYCCRVHFPSNLLAEGLMTAAISVMSLQPKRIHFDETDAVHFQATEAIDGTTARGQFTGYLGSVVRPRLTWEVTSERN